MVEGPTTAAHPAIKCTGIASHQYWILPQNQQPLVVPSQVTYIWQYQSYHHDITSSYHSGHTTVTASFTYVYNQPTYHHYHTIIPPAPHYYYELFYSNKLLLKIILQVKLKAFEIKFQAIALSLVSYSLRPTCCVEDFSNCRERTICAFQCPPVLLDWQYFPRTGIYIMR